MRKLLYAAMLTFIMMVFLLFASVSTVSAAKDEDFLISVGGKSVTKDMTISDVKQLFGEPKLVTDSYWGGSAYTFYGDNYSDYLYLETDEKGSIACYGSVSEGFKTKLYKYGDQMNNTLRVGEEATDYDGYLYGAIYYTPGHRNAYERFDKNFTANNRNICRHAVEMWNAVSFLHGYNTPTSFNDTIFNINSQLAENGSSLYPYTQATGQASVYQLIYGAGSIPFPGYRYPNPLMFAKYGKTYKCKGGAAAFTYIRVGGDKADGCYVGFCSKGLLQEWNQVPLTDREEALAAKASEYMLDSVRTFNSAEKYYDIEPSYESAETITGGMLNEKVARGGVGLLNAIRAGADLPVVEYSKSLSECAQCKSTYTVYLSENGISNPSPHYPPQVAGISDEYYQKCQAGSSENLFFTGIISTSIIGSIQNALDDSAGSGEKYSRGHRYNLLNPSWKYVGLGNTKQQGCHKMSGNQSYNVDVVAWPSNGIMLVGSGFSPSIMWTCKFYNGMKPDAATTIRIDCLNNGESWFIDPANLGKQQDFHVNGNLISYQDQSITFRKNGVYEITFSGLKDENGKEVSYSYRTVYKDVTETGESEGTVTGVTMDSPSIELVENTLGKVSPVIIPASAENKRAYFTSSSPDVVTVNECGELIAKKKGDAVITVTTEDGGFTDTCKVKVITQEEADMAAIAPVKALLDQLPKDVSQVSLGDEEFIASVQEAFLSLTDSQRQRLDPSGEMLSRLEEYNNRIQELKKKAEEDKAAASEVTEAIQELCDPEWISIYDAEDVYRVQGMLDALTDEQRIMVPDETLQRLNDIISALEKTLEEMDINHSEVFDIYDETYSGKPIRQDPEVLFKGEEYLYEGIDYTIKYENNVNVGTATMIFTGIDGYTGTMTKTFRILPKGTTVSKVKAGKKRMAVKWKSQPLQTTGYEIQYGTKRNFGSAKTKVITGAQKKSAIVKKLAKGKRYYVRIRTFTAVDGDMLYSRWSARKSVVVK